MSSWYDPVDDDATPDQVFFQEMERQRLINQVGGNSIGNDPSIGGGPSSSPSSLNTAAAYARTERGSRFANVPLPMAGFPQQPMSMMGGGGGTIGNNVGGGGDSLPPFRPRNVPTMDQIKVAEATLSGYELFQVSDNWLNEELQIQMWKREAENNPNNNSEETSTITTENNKNMKYLNNENDFGDGDSIDAEALENSNGSEKENLEPWDEFVEETDPDRSNVLEVPFPTKGAYYMIDFPTERLLEQLAHNCHIVQGLPVISTGFDMKNKMNLYITY